jgi:hypothetical protein
MDIQKNLSNKKLNLDVLKVVSKVEKRNLKRHAFYTSTITKDFDGHQGYKKK